MIPPDYVGRYATGQGSPADHGRLLLLALEGGHAFLLRARAALERRDYVEFAVDVRRTQDVLLELVRALDEARGRELAEGLGRLHELLVGHLALSSAERSLERIDEALRAYPPIVDAYRAVVRSAGAPA